MSVVDLVICGGGPVGLATAIAARQRGLSACLIERSALPADKACGEGLMPVGVEALDSLGVPLDDAFPISGLCFVDGPRSLSAAFPRGPGRGLTRLALIERLEARARALGVDLLRGRTLRGFERRGETTRVDLGSRDFGRQRVEGRLLVAADGLRSPIRRRLGYELTARRSGPGERYGLRRHFCCPPWSSAVEVHFRDDAEAYVTPLGPERLGVAILTRGRPGRFDELLSRFPSLEQRVRRGGQPLDAVRGAGPLEQRSRAVLAPGVALVGDAAGYRDAITGEGLSLGIRSAIALVERFAGDCLPRFASDHARLSLPVDRLTAAMLIIARRPRLRRRVLDLLGRHPDLTSDLIGLVAGSGAHAACRTGALLRWLAAGPALSRG